MPEFSLPVENAVVVHVDFFDKAYRVQSNVEECKRLVVSCGARVIDVVCLKAHRPQSRYYIGSGKAEEIRQRVSVSGVNVVIFNHTLSPAQERNLEKCFACRVIDRTRLILDIFARRAQTFEGKLQVELAQLDYMSTRLVRGWTHLERQRGGIGLRGPGETQLETDRRLLDVRVKTIHKRLDKVGRQRELMRQARGKRGLQTVSLVGYTNAGKSTLFNLLTGAEVLVADKLFATLDTTVRQLKLGPGNKILLTDTVGFIHDLPHTVINAFHATLEETRLAAVLVHVVDASHPDHLAHIEQVNAVLAQIEADRIPQLLIYNKVDRVVGDGIFPDHEGVGKRLWCSCVTGYGIETIKLALQEMCTVSQSS